MIAVLSKLIEWTLENPAIFNIQQKLFNDYRSVHREFAEYLESDRPLAILDVGCSTGTCAGQIIDMKKNKYYGVDISPRYTKLAADRYPNGNFVTMDARRMTFADDTFDVVMFNGVLHHMPDDLIKDCMKDVARVLKPDGVVLIGEPIFVDSKLSSFLLKLDRGKFIRTTEDYEKTFGPLGTVKRGSFRLSVHTLRSWVLKKNLKTSGAEVKAH